MALATTAPTGTSPARLPGRGCGRVDQHRLGRGSHEALAVQLSIAVEHLAAREVHFLAQRVAQPHGRWPSICWRAPSGFTTTCPYAQTCARLNRAGCLSTRTGHQRDVGARRCRTPLRAPAARGRRGAQPNAFAAASARIIRRSSECRRRIRPDRPWPRRQQVECDSRASVGVGSVRAGPHGEQVEPGAWPRPTAAHRVL